MLDRCSTESSIPCLMALFVLNRVALCNDRHELSTWASVIPVCHVSITYSEPRDKAATKRNLQGPFGKPPAPKTGCIVSAQFTDSSFGPVRSQVIVGKHDNADAAQPMTHRCGRYPRSAGAVPYNKNAAFQSKQYMTWWTLPNCVCRSVCESWLGEKELVRAIWSTGTKILEREETVSW
jgi:hypothetical protein